MTRCWGPWRSVLFVPAHIDRFVEAASRRAADAIQLDLEDSVPAEHKANARRRLGPAVAALSDRGIAVLVRVNRDLSNLVADLECAVVAGVQAISVPKVAGPDHLQLIDERISELEIERSLPAGHIGLIAMIESLSGLDRVETLATACSRLTGLTLGSEDFSADAGMTPSPENLFNPSQRILFAARSAGRQAYGFPGSIAEFNDLETYRRQVSRGRGMGFDGAFCIHPKQVPVLNEVFSLTPGEVSEAREIIAAYQQALAEGRAAASYKGRMIDLPVVCRAEATLARAGGSAVDTG